MAVEKLYKENKNWSNYGWLLPLMSDNAQQTHYEWVVLNFQVIYMNWNVIHLEELV